MASVDWMKMTVQKAGGLAKLHLNKDRRENGNHSNPDIDTSLSNNNYNIGCTDTPDMLKSLKNRTEEVDALYPPQKVRKDRVVACSLYCPCPKEISNKGSEEERKFFEGVHQIYADFFGKENVHGSFIHLDEIHEYTDKDGTSKESLAHAHTIVSAYAEWTEKDKKTGEIKERKGINGKNFEKRDRYNKLNNLINDFCVKEWNIGFLNGGVAQKKRVEELKAEEELHEKKAKINRANSILEAKNEEINKVDSILENKNKENEELEKRNKRLLNAISENQAGKVRAMIEKEKAEEELKLKKSEKFIEDVEIPYRSKLIEKQSFEEYAEEFKDVFTRTLFKSKNTNIKEAYDTYSQWVDDTNAERREEIQHWDEQWQPVIAAKQVLEQKKYYEEIASKIEEEIERRALELQTKKEKELQDQVISLTQKLKAEQNNAVKYKRMGYEQCKKETAEQISQYKQKIEQYEVNISYNDDILNMYEKEYPNSIQKIIELVEKEKEAKILEEDYYLTR